MNMKLPIEKIRSILKRMKKPIGKIHGTLKKVHLHKPKWLHKPDWTGKKPLLCSLGLHSMVPKSYFSAETVGDQLKINEAESKICSRANCGAEKVKRIIIHEIPLPLKEAWMVEVAKRKNAVEIEQ